MPIKLSRGSILGRHVRLIFLPVARKKTYIVSAANTKTLSYMLCLMFVCFTQINSGQQSGCPQLLQLRTCNRYQIWIALAGLSIVLFFFYGIPLGIYTIYLSSPTTVTSKRLYLILRRWAKFTSSVLKKSTTYFVCPEHNAN